jgi:hypothetical protein
MDVLVDEKYYEVAKAARLTAIDNRDSNILVYAHGGQRLDVSARRANRRSPSR